MIRPLLRHQIVVDVVAAVAVFLFAAMFTLLGAGIGLGSPIAIIGALIVTALFAGALALRRLSPALALTVAWVAAVVQMLCALPPLPGNVAIFGVLYAAAAYGSRRLYWVGFASTLVGGASIAAYILLPPMLTYGIDVTNLTSLIASGALLFIAAALGLMLAWTIGALVRTSLRARQSRSDQRRAEDAAIVEQERTRIARDMHDVVAHSLAVVIAQADGARYAAATDPDAATTALTTISTTARSALTDVRLLLTQLRHSQADGPQPTLGDLEELYAQVRGAGIDLRVDVDPAPPGPPPAAVQLAVYRILQEALTNALRHGTGRAVAVSLAWLPDRVELSVRNPASLAGPAARPAVADPQAPRGHGLIGMRERAQLIGGTLEAGATGGAFLVRASLPIGATP